MILKEFDNIEELFKSKLDNHQVEVPTEIWNNIESSLNAPAASSGAGTVGSGVGSSAVVAIAGTAILISTLVWYSGIDTTQKTLPQNKQKSETVKESIEAELESETKEKALDTTELSNDVAMPRKQESKKLIDRSSEKSNKTQREEIVGLEKAATNSSKSGITSTDPNPYVVDEPAQQGQAVYSNSETENSTYQVTENKVAERKEEIRSTVLEPNIISPPAAPSRMRIGDLPNVFSPNGDGQNDNYIIKMSDAKSCSFIVYNANNEIVFESNATKIEWNGADFYGNILSKGTYRVVLVAVDDNGKSQARTQTINLLR